MAVKGQAGGLDRTQNRATAGKTSGSSGGGGKFTGQASADAAKDLEAAHNEGSLAGPSGSMGSQGGNETRTGSQMRNDQSRTGGQSTQDASGPVYDKTGRMVSDGTVPNVPDASLGQKIGLFAGLLPGGLLNSLPDLYDAVKDPSAPPKGGAIGAGIDSLTGETPGRIQGTVPNRVASSTNSRGDRQSDGAAIQDRAQVGDSDSDLTGAAATDYLFSDVQLEDRRKYKPAGAGTAMALGLN